MDAISVGLLLPSSTILPISKDFEKGLKEGLKQAECDVEVDIIKEFIGAGDTKQIETVCNKFFSYDGVDLVTGVISIRAAQDIAERFKNQNKVLLVNELGGNIPNVSLLNPYVFINSPHLWQYAYSLGYWGVKTFGKKGMFIGSVYDAGYGYSQMFYLGMQAADKESEWSFSIPPMPPPGELSNMDVIFPYLEQYQPDFIFAAFCGGETTLFLNELIRHGWHHKTKITGLPYLLTPFKPLNADVTIYTAGPLNNHDVPAKAFYQMGLQTGQTIARAAQQSNGTDLKEQIAEQNSMFNVAYPNAYEKELNIIQNDIVAGQASFTSKIIATCDTYGLDIEQLRPLTTEVSAGWVNPYLCI
jgi:branched-chain amino acid transport system substrate-binding protein